MSDEASEGPRMDVFASCSDGTQRDLFDPKLTAHDFDAWLTAKFASDGSRLPSAIAIELEHLVKGMRQCVAMFNDAFEYVQDDDDDAELDEDK